MVRKGSLLALLVLAILTTGLAVTGPAQARILYGETTRRTASYTVISSTRHFALVAVRDGRSAKADGAKWSRVAKSRRQGVVFRMLSAADKTRRRKHDEPRDITPHVDPSPAPTPVPTPEPTPSETPTPPPTPDPGLEPTLGIMTAEYITAMRQKVDAGVEPWASAWRDDFRYDMASPMAATPDVFAGPELDASGSWGTLQKKLDRDGYYARNVAIGYAVTGEAKYAAKAREFLLAWAKGNHPTTAAQDPDVLGSSYESHGYFSFAYAYDLTKASGVYSDADKTTITTYFRTAAKAMASYLDKWYSTDWVFKNPTATRAYQWTSNPLGLRQNAYDAYVGSDMAALTTVARLALAIEGGDAATVSKLLDPSYVFSVQSIIDHASGGKNDGDGMSGHPQPVPVNNIFKPGGLDNPGRGGCVDYMTYNSRCDLILLLMAQGQGVDVSRQAEELRASWGYLQRFFGANAERSPAPNDVIDPAACLPRFVLALHVFPGDGRLLGVAKSGDTADYYEPQFVGPTTLTLWPLGS